MEKELMSFRFERSLKTRLSELAAATGRSQTFLAEEAIRQYCDLQKWQVEAIQVGIEAAERGDLHGTDAVMRALKAQADVRR